MQKMAKSKASVRIHKQVFKLHHYHWVLQLSLLKDSSHSNNATSNRFPILLIQHNLTYIPTTCTYTIDVTLDWKNFATFYEVVISCEEVKSYAIGHYPNLTYFLESQSSCKKHRLVLLVRPKRMPPSAWRLGLRRVGLK